jgi:Superfamily II RNA helicase
VGFAIVTPSPYIDLHVLTKGFTGHPEAINSQFVISYPMVLNLLKAHPLDQIQPILAKSFAQFQLNQRAEVLERSWTICAIRWSHSGRASAPTGSQNGRPSTKSDGRKRTEPPSEGTNLRKSPHAFTFSPPVAWWVSAAAEALSSGNIAARDRRAR